MENVLLKLNTIALKLIYKLTFKPIRVDAVNLYPFCQLSVRGNGSITIGDGSKIHRGAMIVSTHGSRITMGANTTLQPYSVIHGIDDITIGDETRIASHCMIVSGDHEYGAVDVPIRKQGMRLLPVRIGRDVWIGSGVRILGGAVIGDGCVVGAGSVVKGTLEPYGVYVGVPARKIKSRQ